MTDKDRYLLTLVAVGVVALACIRWAWVREVNATASARASAAALVSLRTIDVPALRDSLRAARDSNRRQLARVDTLIRIRTVTIARADTIRLRADSLAVVATLASDTGAICRPIWTAYRVRTSECDQLRLAVRQDSAALEEARNALAVNATALSGAVGQVEGLRKQLAVVVKPSTCRVLWVVPCLSRKASFVAGLVGGAVLVSRVR